MDNDKSALSSTREILKNVPFNWALLLIVMFLSSVLELLGITIIPVYINLIQGSELQNGNSLLNSVFNFLSAENKESKIIAFSVLLFIVYFLKSITYWFSQIVITNEQQLMQKKLRIKVFNSFLRAPYENYIESDLSEFLQRVYRDVESFMGGIVMNGFVLLMEVLKFIGISIGLIIINPLVVLVLAIMGAIIGYIVRVTKSKVYYYGKVGSESSRNIYKILNQAFTTFIIMRINGSEGFFERKAIASIDKCNDATIKYTALNLLPRLIIEVLIFGFVVGIVLMNLGNNTDPISGIAMVSVFAAASISMVPSLTRIASSITSIKHAEYSAQAVAEILSLTDSIVIEKSERNLDNITSFDSLVLENIEYSYPGYEKKILNGLNFEINKNECVGIIGKSGAGKTTLINIILGVLKPHSGKIKVNGIERADLSILRTFVSYVPQNIVLLDDTIRRNVAYGFDDDEIDNKLVLKCLESAGLMEYINSNQKGFDTVIGENGIKLSGGQRQRIGIARALYKKPKLLIFDEGTSALDNETESKIINTLYELKSDITLIMVAHRLSTLDRANRIIKLEKGQVVLT